MRFEVVDNTININPYRNNRKDYKDIVGGEKILCGIM